uniref:Uncharacterized protein n=1 Tax=Plectus sambesii TaxID=2011161 RepID=A0A914UKN0_9BILA
VAEVFLTAGHAFQKLGDLTLQLNSAADGEENMKWSEPEIDQLRDALTRFAHELDKISDSVQSRTTKHIKTDLKRRVLLDESGRDSASPAPSKRMSLGPKRGGKAYAAAATPRPKAPNDSSHHYLPEAVDFQPEVGPPSF